jgi:hypothetical protein
MDTKTIALILLFGRLVSVMFIVLVIYKQFKLLHVRDVSMRDQRRNLLFLSLVLFLGNFIPIVIDSLTLLSEVSRSKPTTAGVAYGLSNCGTSILSSFSLWVIYRYAERSTKSQ